MTLAADTADGGPGVVVGFPRQDETGRYNSVAVLDGGKVIVVRDKVDLPNYGEFDEKRVFDRRCYAGTGQFPRRAARHPDLRGDLERSRHLRDAGRKRRGNPAGAERLALLSRQGRRPPSGGAPPGDRDRPAADLCQPARRPGRTGLRRRKLRLQCGQVARLPDEPVRRPRWL